WGPQAIGDHGAPVSLPKLKKAYEKGRLHYGRSYLHPITSKVIAKRGTRETVIIYCRQGWTDNSWGPWAIGNHGAPCPCPNLKKPMKKVPGASHGAPY
ncbi:unnamed protein product, partial [Staurois parvus]